MLIVGLAPGLKGANRTGLPFVGDDAGDLLHETLRHAGFAKRIGRVNPHGGVTLTDCRITNAVRCVPPANKPTPAEIGNCKPFLAATITAMPNLRAILALGRIAHDSTLRALDCQLAALPFAHGARHEIRPGLVLFDSFHCSRYNVNTGRLSPAMLQAVLAAIRAELGRARLDEDKVA